MPILAKKLDPNLLSRVKVQSSASLKLGCLIYVRNINTAKRELAKRFNQQAIVGEYPFIDAIGLCATVPELEYLADCTWVEYISGQVAVSALLDKTRAILGIDELHDEGICGQGVTAVVIDTGAYPHLDITLGHKRILKFKDFINNKSVPYDDNGHGTFVAGVLAGNGVVSNGKYGGIAPMANIIVLKALDNLGQTETFTILNAMQWVYENKHRYKIKVVCMSFGSNPLPKNDPLIRGAESLWDSGIAVVCAGGNDGPAPNTIKSPGSSAKIITVGSAKYTDGHFNVADFSSRGPARNRVKPDLLAPGVDITGTKNSTDFYTTMSGTSVSTPFVAGVAALLYQKYPHYSPNQIKSLLLHTAIRLPCDPNSCGRGLLNPIDAIW